MAKIENTQFESSMYDVGKILAKFIKHIPLSFFDLLSFYFQLEVEGLENVPKNSKGIIVSNHSNAFGYDGYMLGYALLKKLQRVPRTMLHNFWFQKGFTSGIARSFGLFPADLKEGLRNLKRDNLVVIFPEGSHGNFKVSSSMYKLVDFNPGFVPLAIMQNAPVIPTVIMGAEETHLNLGKIDFFEKFIGAPIPIPLNLIPFPVKWKIKFLKPINFTNYSKKDIKDARFVKEINQNIRYRIQHEIKKELKDRPMVF